ncbi:hypothetical protein GWW69_00800 [Campylobacter upsaliensis]|nr:hypothetical protein [Campylobacter upsaliensis]
MKREQGKKASQKRLNLTPFLCGGGAGSSRVKQGQAGSSRVKQGQAGSSVWRRGQTRLKRHGKFKPNGKANSSQI